MHLIKKITAGLVLMSSAMAAHAEFSGNISISNNYIWRGLTQTQDQPAISGGLDWAHSSGFYIGTWASNVEYASEDAFSYEHDIYAGYSGEYNGVSFDVGYLYYNYNEAAEFDFGEIYGSLGYGGFSVTAFVFAHTQADESLGRGITTNGRDYDFGFGETYYISLDYGFELPQLEGWEFGLHAGYHDGDFVDAFNFADNIFDYFDWNVSVGKGGFSFLVSGTDLSRSPDSLNNNNLKFVVSYGIDF